MKTSVTGITLLCLTALCSCSAEKPQAGIEIPAPLTSPVAEPDLSKARTNGDLLELLLDCQLSLRVCNGKLNAIHQAYGGKTE